MYKVVLAAFVALVAAAPAPQPDADLVIKTIPVGKTLLENRQVLINASDVVDGISRPVTLIFARGTSELGNMGNIVGGSFANALIADLGADQVAVQGVDYPADIGGALSGDFDPNDLEGSQVMANYVNMALALGTTKVAISGYSQGAEVVHGALSKLTLGQVAAAVTFGDPLQGDAFLNIAAADTKVYCADGDGVCTAIADITAAHFSYGTNGDAEDAATFVAGIVG